MSSSSGEMTPEQMQKMLNGPAYPLPDGVTPQFENPPNNNAAVIVSVTISMVLCLSTYLIYAYSRIFVAKKVSIADFFAVGALACYLGLVVRIISVMNFVGYFVPQYHIQRKDMPHYMKLYMEGVTFYIFSAMIIRVAILVQWMELFVPKTRNTFWWTCLTVLVIQTAFYIVAAVDSRVQIGGGRGWALASASMNVVVDVVILLLPQKVIWGLNLPARKRWGISIIFSLGILACVAAITRVIVTARRYYNEDHSEIPLQQTSYLSLVSLLSFAETSFGILVFTFTGVPKAFSSLGLAPVSQLASSMRRWLSSLSSSQSKGESLSGNEDYSRGLDLDEMRLNNGSGSYKEQKYRQGSRERDRGHEEHWSDKSGMDMSPYDVVTVNRMERTHSQV